jgi:hypothetical protein
MELVTSRPDADHVEGMVWVMYRVFGFMDSLIRRDLIRQQFVSRFHME